MFDDLLDANRRFQQTFQDTGLPGSAARGLAVLTCIDSRIDPLAMLGLAPGDAKILRNAGARVTPDALRSLVLAVNLLNVDRICVVRHTDCAMASRTNDELQALISERSGGDAGGWDFLPISEPGATIAADVELIRACPLVPGHVTIGAFELDVRTGALRAFDTTS